MSEKEVLVGSPSNIHIIENFVDKELLEYTLDILKSANWRRGPFNWVCHPYEQEHQGAFPDLLATVLPMASYMYGAVLDRHSQSFVKWTVDDTLEVHTDAENADCKLPHDNAGHAVSPATILYTTLVYFNDDYDGGELNFPHHKIKLKPKPGTLVMFPSTCMYAHEVLPITAGDRYTYSMFCTSKSLLNMFADMRAALET